MNNYIKNVAFCLILGLTFSCGPKKGIVTKKDKEKRVSTVTKEKEKPVKVETEIVSKPVSKPIRSTTAYIEHFKNVAMEEMRIYKIPASITLAQGILESGSGKGRLSVQANNHFGIKCHGWTGKKIYHDDDRRQECFRKYDNPNTSYRDHSKFLTNRSRYSKLFDLRLDDYKGWARGLRAAGYATDRKYPEKLISLIERYKLYRYDRQVLGGKSNLEKSNTKSKTIKHTVIQGDTLYSLSKRYGVSVEAIQRLNNIKGNSISIGQVLQIKK